MIVNASNLEWTYNSRYKQRCFYNPYPHGSATWTGNGPTGCRNCAHEPWNSGRGGYNYRHELITCSPEFQWCKLLKTVCEWNHEEGRLVKRTAPIHCDTDWTALANAGYIIYDESVHTWYATEQGRALNKLIKEAFADQAAAAKWAAEQEEKEKKEQEEKEKREEPKETPKETASLPLGVSCGVSCGSISGAPENSEDIPEQSYSENGMIKDAKKPHMKIKTFSFWITSFFGSADLGPYGVFKSHWDDRVVPSEEIDKTINEFTAKVNVVSITVNYCTFNQHNNGGCDDTQAIYTIVYND